MATTVQLQKQLRDAMQKSADNFRGLTNQQMIFAIKQIDQTRSELAEKLASQAGADGSFKRERITQIMKDLDAIEQRIREEWLDTMEIVTKQTAEFVAKHRKSSMERTLGDGGSAGVQFNRLPENVFKYVSTRFAADGLVLSDRVWQASGQLRDQLGSVIRQGILQGKALNTMIADVRRVYENDTWKIRRLVLTESAIAYRTADSYVAQQSKFVKGVKIHKGRADRPNHMCTILAGQDRYNLGTGVYPPNDISVLNPHPNCTSWLEYVLDEQKIQERNAEQSKLGGSSTKQSAPKTTSTPKAAATPAPAAINPMDELAVARNKKALTAWAEKYLGADLIDYSHYDIAAARAMNESMYAMKQRFPEVFAAKIRSISDTNEYNDRKYEIQLENAIRHNMKTHKYWSQQPDTPETRKALRDAIIKAKVVKKDRINSRTNAFAQSSATGIFEELNGIYFARDRVGDWDKFAEGQIRAFKVGWATTDTAEGIIYHEFGHSLDYWLKDVGRRDWFDALWNQAASKDVDWWKKSISEYGRTNDKEMFAELFAEYVVNKEPRPIAVHFGKMLEEAIDKHRRGK